MSSPILSVDINPVPIMHTTIHHSKSTLPTTLAATGLALLLLLAGSPKDALSQETAVLDMENPGKQLFGLVCAMCHSEQPPVLAAPPMAMVVRHYRQALSTEDSVRTAIMTYVRKPSAEASLLPAHAIERFGLMPAQPQLTDEQLGHIVDYIMTLEAKPMQGGGMQGGMQGHQHGRQGQ
ncbi:MAG: cytochrome c [Rhodothermales bacterium]